MKGSVKFFNQVKGFGFITPSDGSADVFVHFTGIAGPKSVRKVLEQGQEVEFDIVPGEKGPKADGVRILEAA